MKDSEFAEIFKGKKIQERNLEGNLLVPSFNPSFKELFSEPVHLGMRVN